MENVLERLKLGKSGIETTGFRLNNPETNVIHEVSGPELQPMNDFRQYPCVVCKKAIRRNVIKRNTYVSHRLPDNARPLNQGTRALMIHARLLVSVHLKQSLRG